jgi:PPOX class probable FMN-dependent enzyme
MTPESLRETYAPATDRARLKSMRRLDSHCRRFIEKSPFLCLGTQGPGGADVAPRGDHPGFVHVLDDTTLAIPDWPGNNRLDSLTNITENPQVGLLFLVPGVDETLRINGVAAISMDSTILDSWNVNGKHPKSALIVTIHETFLHCGKALIRSRLWHDDYKIQRAELPSLGQMLKDQINSKDSAAEMELAIAEAYKNKLY